MEFKKINAKSLISKSLLLVTAAIIFILAHPNFINENGYGFLGWFCYLPVLFLIEKLNYKNAWLYGGLFAILFYSGFSFWLKNYDILCLAGILVYYFVFYAVFFELLCFTTSFRTHNSFISNALAIFVFEYLKTKGFMGISFGVTAYTQWNNLKFLQIGEFVGVWGINLILILNSCILFQFAKDYLLYKSKTINLFLLRSFPIYLLIIAGIFVYGNFRLKSFDYDNFIKVAAIQSNEDPDENSIASSNATLKKLKQLSNKAIKENPSPDLIVWSETSVIPSIIYKTNNVNTDIETRKFLNDVLSFIDEKDVSFVIGNNHTEYDFSKNEIDHYSNAALFFSRNQSAYDLQPQIYEKQHLVPFTEIAPFKKVFPSIANKIENQFGYSYKPGKGPVVFQEKELYFSTPICFEDCFPEIACEMFNKGARALIVLTNDSWSKSKACQFEHMAMSVFRSVENRIPVVRCGTSGQSCIIYPDGSISEMSLSFDENVCSGNVPVISQTKGRTFFNLAGKYLPFFIIVLLLIQMITVIIIRVLIK